MMHNAVRLVSFLHSSEVGLTNFVSLSVVQTIAKEEITEKRDVLEEMFG